MSSLVIVPVVDAPVVILEAGTEVGVTVLKAIENVSLASTSWSPLIVTEMVFVSPAAPVKVSGLAVFTVKSVPTAAVPAVELKATVKPPETALSELTVKLTV